MKTEFLNIGFGNMVSAGKIVALISPESAPVKRMIQDARDEHVLVDATCGRKTRSFGNGAGANRFVGFAD